MVSSKEVQDLSPMMGKVEVGIEDVFLLLESFVSYDRWEYMGEICKRIHEGVGIYIRPERLGKVAKDMRVIKRMWTELGWKYKKIRTLRDYRD